MTEAAPLPSHDPGRASNAPRRRSSGTRETTALAIGSQRRGAPSAPPPSSRPGRDLPRAFYLRHATEVARDLLGMLLVRDGVGGRIVETEAYHEEEPASHAFRGPTRRNASLFLRGGHLYVYRIHQCVCANVSCGPAGSGQGVLFRALAPTVGEDVIAARRAGAPRRAWTDGPGKLCRALAIGLEDDGQDLLARAARVRLLAGEPVPPGRVLVGPRVGISKAVELPWRFRALSDPA